MRSDYKEIRDQNILDYGRKTSHLDLFRQLYADRTHFIYELLQNAEDAGATKIRFSLHSDRLEVSHNGRAFTHHDVQAICGVGVGTKQDELTQIGRFGIGFKSVFAYTDTPHIYSDDERFLIKDFVRPEKAPKRTNGADDTMFVLPFDRSEPSAEVSREEIEIGLQRLHGDALLFLTNLTRISVLVGGERIVQLKRKRRGQTVSLVMKGSKGVERERWRVFGAGSVGDVDDPRVEIALLLDDEGSVVRDPRPQLSAYFPTDKETGLRFRVQGPYRTTPARDNVPAEDEWNRRLVERTASLVASALLQFRDDGSLGLDVLRVMPFDEDDTPKGSTFYPMYEAVLAVMRTEDLIPIEGGGFAGTGACRLGRSAVLRSLLDDRQLADLIGSGEPVHWVDGRITSQSDFGIHWYLTHELEIQELTPTTMVSDVNRKWLSHQSTEWMIGFYRFLSDQRALWRGWNAPLRSVRFVRLEDGSHVRSEKAFLPPLGKSAFPIVDREIAADDEVLEFLKELGLKQPDAVDDLIRRVIRKYGSKQRGQSVDDLNADDINEIRSLLRTASESQRTRLLSAVWGKPIFRAWNEVTELTEYRSGSQLLSRNAVTQMWFDGNDDVWWLDDGYQLMSDELDAFRIKSGVAVVRRQPSYQGFVVLQNYRGAHERGLGGFDPDPKIHGLDHALGQINIDRARYLWSEILGPDPILVSGETESATRQDYSNSSVKSVVSGIGERLRTVPWLPFDGGFVAAADLSVDDLPEGFNRNHNLAERLGLRSTTVDELARQHGMAPDDLQWALQHPDEFTQLLSAVRVQVSTTGEGEEEAPNDGDRTDTQQQEAAIDAVVDSRSESRRSGGRSRGVDASHRTASGGRTAGESTASAAILGDPQADSQGTIGGAPKDTENSSGRDRGPRVTYLASSEPKETDGDIGEERRRVERVGIDTVLSIELAEGREPEEMPPNNPGYDIRSVDGADVRYIEVKALKGDWASSGVALTVTEYQHSVKHGSAYWLYVVERCDAERRVTMIRYPGGKPTQYVFDSGWRDLPDEERLRPF